MLFSALWQILRQKSSLPNRNTLSFGLDRSLKRVLAVLAITKLYSTFCTSTWVPHNGTPGEKMASVLINCSHD